MYLCTVFMTRTCKKYTKLKKDDVTRYCVDYSIVRKEGCQKGRASGRPQVVAREREFYHGKEMRNRLYKLFMHLCVGKTPTSPTPYPANQVI